MKALDFSGYYFGSLTAAARTPTAAEIEAGSGNFALVVREDQTGILLAHLPGQQTALVASNVRIDPFGSVATLDGDRLTGEFAYLRVPFALDRVAALPPWRDTPEPDVPRGPDPRWTRAIGAAVWASPVARDRPPR